jgi:competence protein ComEA
MKIVRLKIGLGLFLAFVVTAAAQVQLPDGPGKEETQRVCKGCHELERSVSKRQDRDGWRATLEKMAGLGAKAPQKDMEAILDYLAKNYAADDVPKVNVNTATSIQLESGLTLRRSQAAALIAYREKNGEFKSIEDLKKVPGIDAEKIEAKKDRIAFK